MIKFEIKPHHISHTEVVEITRDGALLATVVFNEEMQEVRVISKYLASCQAAPSAMPGVSPGIVYVALNITPQEQRN